MRAFHIARSLLSAPRLLASLLLWPFVIGLCIALFQLLFTTLQLSRLDESPDEYKERREELQVDEQWMREWMFGDKEPFDTIMVCRWDADPDAAAHPQQDCEFEWNDIAINSETPLTVSVKDFEDLFQSVTRRIHVCRDCKTAVTVDVNGEEPLMHLRGLSAISLYYFIEQRENRALVDIYKGAREIAEDWSDARGDIYFHLDGDEEPIKLTGGRQTIFLVFHTACIVLVALWLALRAHRRVLDYFSKNGALLPLVAACGKDQFYSAVWLITCARVGCFLIASVPLTVVVYLALLKDSTLDRFVGDPWGFLLWITCFVSSTALLTMIASIAELRERQTMFSWMYKVVPFLAAIGGGAVWAGLALLGGPEWGAYKSMISATPIVGVCPVIIAPLLNIADDTMAVHTMLSVMLVIWLLRNNASWFAAHLEEL